MSKFNTINSLIKLYTTSMPFVTIFSTVLAIDSGITVNKRLYTNNNNSFDIYSNLIGYTSLGIVTGILYPISYPVFGYYVLYKNNKS